MEAGVPKAEPRRITLTARNVSKLRPKRMPTKPGEVVQEDYIDKDGPTGLRVRTSSSGRNVYFLRYRIGGVPKKTTIGKVEEWSLADARERARRIVQAAQEGRDLLEEERGALEAAMKAKDAEQRHTFREMCVEAMESKHDDTREATRSERQRILDLDLLPAWGSRPAHSISRREVIELRDKIKKRGPTMANRTIALVKMLYNVGLDREFPLVEANPAARIEPLPEGSRDRYLKRDEIKQLWKALSTENPTTKAVFEIGLLTAQRAGSVMSMRWADIDDADVWMIPKESFKGDRPHAVPLSPQALAVLKAMRPISGENEYVFPGRGDGESGHMASTSKALQRIVAKSELDPWVYHDFRTTFRTHATRALKPKDKRDPAGLGVEPHVADAVLGHKDLSLGTTRYTADVARFLLSEKRDALTKWGKFVMAAVAEKRPAGRRNR